MDLCVQSLKWKNTRHSESPTNELKSQHILLFILTVTVIAIAITSLFQSQQLATMDKMTETPNNSSLRPLSPLSMSNVQLSTPAKQIKRTPDTPTSDDDDMDLAKWCDDFGAADDCRDENDDLMRLSSIQHVNLNTTLAASTRCNENEPTTPITSPSSEFKNSSFPENEQDVEIQSPSTPEPQEYNADEEETEEERIQREMEESEALARQMMAEEAMATYQMSIENLRNNADHFSEEDLAALQAAMAEEDPEEDEAGEDEDSHEMSYDALLRLGERIGDVKDERWACVAHDKIDKIPILIFESSMAEGKDENHTHVKCLICQENYEEGDELRCLPCQHCFHKDCIDTWLSTKDTCAFCRKSIESE